ncbi:MAG: hypothetical protein EGMGGAKC_00971 [Dehalococcoides mccartyi]|nr:hypothetical protein [Dehalococcoides mccartyi]
MIAFVIFSQQHQMVIVFICRCFGGTVTICQIEFAAQYRFYTCFFGLFVKTGNTVHSTMVGNSQRLHAKFFGTGYQLGDTAHAVQQAEFGVDMQMTKHRLS